MDEPEGLTATQWAQTILRYGEASVQDVSGTYTKA